MPRLTASKIPIVPALAAAALLCGSVALRADDAVHFPDARSWP